MARPLFRHYITWRSVSLMVIVVTTITMMGMFTVHNNKCMMFTTFNNDDDNSLIKSSHLASQREAVPGNVGQFYWLDNLATLNITNGTNNKYLMPSSDLRTHNLSKVNQKWFQVLPEENYLKNNTDFFTKSDQIKSTFNEHYIINEENVCVGNAPFLLVIIPSLASNTEQRDAIRWTWLSAAEKSAWPKTFIKEKVKHIFLFGVRVGKESDDYKQLMEESQIFGDIVLADFVDTYRNLSRKIITGLLWAHQYCKHAQFVLKTDEDTFINVPVMIEVLQHVEEKNKNKSFVIGLEHSYNKPPVVREGRWGVSKEEYALDFYPKYMYGHAYVLNNKALSSIVDVAPYVNLISPEDALVTGILPKFAKVMRISAPSFTVCCRHIFDCEVVWNERVALPEIKSTKLMAQLWANIITHSCNYTTPFIK